MENGAGAVGDECGDCCGDQCGNVGHAEMKVLVGEYIRGIRHKA